MRRKPPLTTQPAAADWERMFKVLRYFHGAHDHCDVPPNPAPGSLGHWLAEQRKAHQAGRLPPERFKRLEALGVVFDAVLDARGRLQMSRDERWNVNFEKLVAFKQRFGHCVAPCHWREDHLFGHWVSTQRSYRNKGLLRPDRLARLEKLGFVWDPLYPHLASLAPETALAPARDRHWDVLLTAFLQFKEKHGHCIVTRNDGMKGRLHKWMVRQRSKARENRLPPAHRQRLDEAGFPWQSRIRQWNNWNEMFAKLVAFKERFGHCDVKCHWREDRLFGHWVANQRSFRKKGILSPERIARLEELGFRWAIHYRRAMPPPSYGEWLSAIDRQWNMMFAALLDYQKQHGLANIQPDDGHEGRLYQWVLRQQQCARRNELRPIRRQRLEEAGFPWRIPLRHDYNWDRRFAQLAAYWQRFGHCNVPSQWREDRPFGHWVSNQRIFRKKGILSPERIARLDELGFRWVIHRRR